MKNSIISFCLVAVFLVTASFSKASNPVNNETNVVEVTAVDDLHLGNSIQKIWKVSFAKEGEPVTVALLPTAQGSEYIVRSKFFEVVYVNDKDGFGVKKVHGSLKEVPATINSFVLNKQQLKQQRILSPDKVTDGTAIALITSYLPDLINENYKHLIY